MWMYRCRRDRNGLRILRPFTGRLKDNPKRRRNAITDEVSTGAVMKAAYPARMVISVADLRSEIPGPSPNKEMVKMMDEKGMATEWLKNRSGKSFDPAHVTQKEFDEIMGR